MLAGGVSSRFGSDKALAVMEGQTLLVRAVARLSGWCDHVVVVGREVAPAPCLPDWPQPGMGPLGGIAAALRYAADHSFEAVLTCGVDSLGLPDDLPALLSPAPAFVPQQPVIGLWPASAAPVIEAILTGPGRHSMRAFAEALEARAVALLTHPANINTPGDLADWQAR